MDVIRWGNLTYIMMCLTISVNIQAQKNPAPLQKQVRITNTLFSIDSLSRLITAQTGVFLSFNSNKVEAGKKIATRKRSYAVAELLELIKSNTGSDYKIYKDHVIFHGGDKKQAFAKETISYDAKRMNAQKAVKYKTSKSSTGSIKSATAKKISTATTLVDKFKLSSGKSESTSKIKTASTSTAKGHTLPDQASAKSSTNTEVTLPPVIKPDPTSSPSSEKPRAITKNTSSLPLEPLKTTSPQMQKPSITLLLKPAILAQRPTPSPQKTRWFADAGFTVDDVLYLNASITAGHKFLHGFFSWSSSFKVSGFRYGLGSMVPVNNEWRIGLMVTTGKLNRNIHFNGVRDSSKNITVKSELHRLAIQVEKSLRPNLIVKAGPVFNLLKSSYYQNGSPVTIATSGYEGTNGDREFYTVRPLYTLSNSYKTTESTNTKTWIGFQVSLCYRFNF